MRKGRNGLKRKAALWMAAMLCMGTAGTMSEMEVSAAEAPAAETTAVVTTQRCSIWSAPATTEENRVKYVDAGYQITIYPEVIQSEAGDGKTFYRTVKGAYVLCRCVTGGNGAGAENAAQAAGEAGTAGAGWVPWEVPANAAIPPAFDVVSASSKWEPRKNLFNYDGTKPYEGYDYIEYDESGRIIKKTYYNLDKITVTGYEVWEYDEFGNGFKEGHWTGNGTLEGWYYYYFEELEPYMPEKYQGSQARWQVSKSKSIVYYADGTVNHGSYFERKTYSSKKETTYTETYYPDGCYRIDTWTQTLGENSRWNIHREDIWHNSDGSTSAASIHGHSTYSP